MAYLGSNAPVVTMSEIVSFYDPTAVDTIEAAIVLLKDGRTAARQAALGKFESASQDLDLNLMEYWAAVYVQIRNLERGCAQDTRHH